jgi:hypothetical protein
MSCRGRPPAGAGPSLLPCGDGPLFPHHDKPDTAIVTALCGRSARRLQDVMPVEGSCHCGNVRIELPSLPAWVADCNCSLCRRTAWRTAYYPPADVHISGETVAYVWGDHMIGIHHCPVCGCGTHWQTLGEDFGKVGINARLLDDFNESTVEVRKFNNAT